MRNCFIVSIMLNLTVSKTKWIIVLSFTVIIIMAIFSMFVSEYNTENNTEKGIQFRSYLAKVAPHTFLNNYIKKFYFICPKGKIAIGMAYTTRDVKKYTKEDLKDNSSLFRDMLPTFCATLSRGFCYRIYFGIDSYDRVFTQSLTTFTSTVDEFIFAYCAFPIDYLLLSYNYTKKPAWAQNDVMMKAYEDGFDYFYQVNDDTKFVSGQWTEAFISTLSRMTPKNVGVVGPAHHGGNDKILTYPFVHRTHMDIFGYFYPSEFTDWYADKWITGLYEPNNTRKLWKIQLIHTMLKGTRYQVYGDMGRHVQSLINSSKSFMMRYLKGQKPC